MIEDLTIGIVSGQTEAPARPTPPGELQIRIFRMSCVMIACVSLTLMIPLYVAQGLTPVYAVGLVALGVTGLVCYWASRRGHHLFVIFLLMLLANISLYWTLDFGSAGGLCFYYAPVLLYPMTLFRGLKRWFFSALTAGNLIALLSFDYFHPGVSRAFSHPLAQVEDRMTGILCSFVIIGTVMWMVLRGYDTEQSKLTRAKAELIEKNTELEEALANVTQLKGLLPICCECKKIRDDENYWHQVETYLARHSDVKFTHSYCPDCSQQFLSRLGTPPSA